MRLLVGGSLLLALFAAAILWQRHWTAEARAAREAARSGARVATVGHDETPGWGRVIVGRPSGAAPLLEAPSGQSPGAQPTVGQLTVPETSSAAAEKPKGEAPEFQLVVQNGQNLSGICRAHYGSARAELVRALARYNGLADENQLRVGQSLRLPAIEKLAVKSP